MGVTLAITGRNVVGNRRVVEFNVTGDSSYATGGESLTAADVNLLMPEYAGQLAATDSDKVLLYVSESDSTGRYTSLDKTNDKIMFWAAGAEVAGATNLSAVTIKARAEYFA